jgi:hypothetical protein
MTRNRPIAVEIDKLQNQLIIQKAREFGYKNKTAFARDKLLSDDFSVERMINRIHESVCKNVRR